MDLFLFRPRWSDGIIQEIGGCIKDIEFWMSKNFLKLNGNKRKIMVFGSTYQQKKHSCESAPIRTVSIVPLSKVRNLGVVQNADLSMVAHASHTFVR